MSGWTSHKVTDPKPVLRNKDGGFAYTGMTGSAGLNAAYETMDRAKTALRRAERHIAHAEKRSVEDISPFGPGGFSIPVDRVPSYSIPSEISDPPAQIKLDKFGRSSYLRAKDSVSRKVSRMDEKYTDDFDVLTHRNTSPLREANVNVGPLDGHSNIGSKDSINGGYRFSSSKNVEVSLSDSKASREMDRRILNDKTDQDLQLRFERSYPYPSKKLTHVDVPVPGHPQTRPRQSAADPTWQSITYPGAPNSVMSSNSTFTVSGKSSSSSQKAKLNLNSEKLEKLREKIRQQRLNTLNGMGIKPTEPPPEMQNHASHREEDPVVPRNYPEYDLASQPPLPMIRKVASGPPVPRYKGFSEAHTNWEEADSEKMSRASHSRKKASLPPHPVNAPPNFSAGDDSKHEKQHRVVAQMKHAQRSEKQKDVITTRSWRQGARIVNKALGPNKLPVTGDSPPTKDKTRSRLSEEDHEVRKAEESMDEQQLVNQATKMSDEAKAILTDMQMGDADEQDDNDESQEEGRETSMKKRSMKRQRLKTVEQEQDIKAAKVRHYDTDEVRKYIAKQKIQRKKQMQTEAEIRKKAEEKKQLQLQELYEKQKVAARSRSASARRSRSREDLREYKHKSNSSDKENQHGMDTSSSDTSTLTGENTPVANDRSRSDRVKTPDHSTEDVDMLVQKYSGKTLQPVSLKDKTEEGKGGSLPGTQDSGFAMTADEIIAKYLNGQTTDNIINQYSEQAEAIKINFNGKEGSGAQERGRPSGQRMVTSLPQHNPNVQAISALPSRPYSASAAGGRSRIDRLESIKQTAHFLQSRLNVETKRLAWEIDKVPVPGETERLTVAEGQSDVSDDNDKFATRYDRVTGAEEDSAVFDHDLPGVTSLDEHTREREKKQKVSLSNGQTALKQYGKSAGLGEFSDIDSNLSDSTSEDAAGRGVVKRSEPWADRISSKTIPAVSFHTDQPPPAIDSIRYKPYNRSQPANIPSSVTTRVNYGYNLDKPEADPYSILNIYSRRSQSQKQSLKPQGSLPATIAPSKAPSRRTPISENFRKSNGSSGEDYDSLEEQSLHSSILSEHPYSDDFSEEKSKSAGVSKKSGDSATKGNSLSAKSDLESFGSPPRSNRKPSTQKSSFKEDQNRAGASDEERTLEEVGSDNSLNDTLTPVSDNSQEQEKSAQKSQASGATNGDAKLKSESLVLSSKGLSKRRPAGNGSETTASSIVDESNFRRSKEAQYPRVHDIHVSARVDARFSPNTLERRMAAELNLLEGVDESINQLTSVERIRAVGLAQQETVSLAQIIKARQLNHQQELEAAKLKHREDVLQSTRQVEDARRRAADATQEAASAIWSARNEATNSLQDSTQKLLATQAEAARATADAARQFAEVSKTATQQTRTAYDVSTIAKESASAAASAAVNAALASYPYSKYLGMPKMDRSAQYSLKSQSSTDYTRSAGTSYNSSFESMHSASQTPSASPAVKNGVSSKRDLSESIGSDVMTAADLSVSVGKQSSIKSASVKTASDASMNRTVSSIKEESGAVVGQSSPSKSESIAEELPSDKDDYSIEFDTSVTEEELEKSLREVVPTEGHRKTFKRRNSLSDISSADDSQLHTSMSIGSSASKKMSFENDSFTHFTVEMVRQYMREEEIRAQHQNALLKLREKALKEKTKAELAWLEQQKQHMRDKGADDVYPQLKKRRRGLLLRLQQEQTEIKRLKEASKAAAKDRQLLLRHSQEIAKLQQSTQQVLRRMKEHQSRASKWLLGGGGPGLDIDLKRDLSHDLDLYLNYPQDQESRDTSPASSIPFDSSESSDQVREKIKRSVPGEDGKSGTADEASVPEDVSADAGTKTPPRKGTDTDVSLNQSHMSSPSAEIVQKLKMKLDQKYLTVREQKLQQRRQQVEELLAWKEKLDEEEAMIRRMEKEALQTFQRTQKSKQKTTPPSVSTSKSKVSSGEKEVSFAEPSSKKKDETESEKEEPTGTQHTPRTPRADTIAEETLASQVASDAGSISEDISVSMTSTSANGKSKSAAHSSIQESIKTTSSATKDIETEISASQSKKRTRDSEVETPTTSIQEYTNDAFETESAHATEAVSTSKKTSGSPSKEIATISNGKVITRPPRSPLRRNSESESEDSFSMPYSAENISDQSDVEGRIRALTEELKLKKAEADQIKREEKKKHKQRLKEQETSLKKQIEVYEKYIDQLKGDVTVENQEKKESQNVPKIKQPSEGRLLGKSAEPITSPGKAVPVSAIELSISEDSNASLHQESSLSSEGSVKHKISSSTPSKPVSLKESSVELDLTPVHSVHSSKSSTPQHTLIERSVSVEKPSAPSAISDEDDIKEDSILEQSSTDKSSQALFVIKKDSKTDSKDDKSESKQESRTESKQESRTESDIPTRTENESANEIETAKESKDSEADYSVSKGALSDKSVQESEREETKSLSKDDIRTEIASKAETDKQDVTSEVASEVASEVSEQEPSLSQRSEESFHYSSGPSSQKTYSEFSSHSQSSQSSNASENLSQKAKSESIADSIHSDVEQEISDHASVERTAFSDSPQLKLDLGALKDADSEDEKEADVKSKKDEPKDETKESAKDIDDIADTPRMTDDLDLEEMDDPLSQFSIGDRVLVGGSEAGTLRFKGHTSFADGFFGGIELDRPEGTCDGSLKGVQYFTCEDNYGIFAPPEKLQFLDTESEQKSLREDESLPDSRQEQVHTETDSAKDAESSIAEDISISSELERAINSAAAAVEEFGSVPGQDKTPETKDAPETEEILEVKEQEIDEKQKEEVKKQTMETLVDTVTDSILQKVAEVKVDSNGQDTTPLDVATRNLLNESISQIMDIYHRRKSSSGSEDEPEIIDTASPVILEHIEFTETSEKEDKFTEQEEDNDRWAGDLGEKIKVTQDDDFLNQVPSSFPEFSAGLSAEKEDLAMMYHELEALTGEEWMDDDFGLGIQPKAPPPYPENRGRPDISAALANLAKEPLFFIPHKKEDIENVVKSCVDLFWERRRYGEPWDDYSAPPELFESSESNDNMEGKSKHAFKSFLFDLTGDILRDTYREEDVDGDDDFVWQKTRRLVKRKFYRGGSPPLTVGEVRPIVEHNVLKLLGHTEDPTNTSRFNKWSSRKKRDHVDKVLLKELKEEEPDWVNYAEDELTVKYQIADSIFDSLLSETAQVMTDIMASKSGESEC